MCLREEECLLLRPSRLLCWACLGETLHNHGQHLSAWGRQVNRCCPLALQQPLLLTACHCRITYQRCPSGSQGSGSFRLCQSRSLLGQHAQPQGPQCRHCCLQEWELLMIMSGYGWMHDGMPKAASGSKEQSKNHPTSGVHGSVVRIADRTKEGVDGRDTCRLTLQGDKSLSIMSYCRHACAKVLHHWAGKVALLALRCCQTDGGMPRWSAEGAHVKGCLETKCKGAALQWGCRAAARLRCWWPYCSVKTSFCCHTGTCAP